MGRCTALRLAPHNLNVRLLMTKAAIILLCGFVTGCATCERVLVSSAEPSSGMYEMSICGKALGAHSTTVPGRGSPQYQYIEGNANNFLKFTEALSSCQVVPGSLIFMESGDWISMKIDCSKEVELEKIDYVSYTKDGKVVHHFQTDAELSRHGAQQSNQSLKSGTPKSGAP